MILEKNLELYSISIQPKGSNLTIMLNGKRYDSFAIYHDFKLLTVEREKRHCFRVTLKHT